MTNANLELPVHIKWLADFLPTLVAMTDNRQLILDLKSYETITVKRHHCRVEKSHSALELSRGHYRFRN